MLKPLSLTTPLQPHETATSFASRLAQRNGRPTLGAFCGDMGIEVSKLASGCPEILGHLSHLGGIDPEGLKFNSPRLLDNKRYLVGHETIWSRHLNKTALRFCPLCLSEDVVAGGELGPYCRISWNIRAITCCNRHRIELNNQEKRSQGILAQDFSVRATLEIDTAYSAKEELVSARDLSLERYIWKRVSVGQADTWLDTLPLNACNAFCHYFGALLKFGPNADRSLISASNWRKAGAKGFDTLRTSRTAFGENLARFRTPPIGSTDRRRKDYFIFAHWLSSVKHLEQFIPIWNLFEAYLMEYHPVGTALTNYANSTHRSNYVSIESLHVNEGIFPTYINYWMIKKGKAITSTQSSRPIQIKPLTKKDAREIVAEFRGLLPIEDAAELLNVTTDLLDDLCRASLLEPVAYRLGRKRLFRRGEILTFRQKILDGVTEVEGASNGTMSIRDLAKKFSCKAIILLEGVLIGAFQSKVMIKGRTALLDVELDLAEAERFSIGDPTIGIHKVELVHRLKVNAICLDALVATGYLSLLKNGLNRAIESGRAIVDLNSVTAFETEYVSLAKLSVETGLQYSKLSSQLRQLCISYLTFKNKSTSWIYKRSDLAPIALQRPPSISK